jgi:hypothetical protein
MGAWVVGHEVAYRLLGVPFAPWYQIQTVVAVLALVAFGFVALGRFTAHPNGTIAARLLAAVLALVCAAPLAAAAGRVISTAGHAPDPRYDGYFEVARAVRAARGESAEARGPGAIAATEIGVLGYFSRAPIIDLMGLVEPEVLAARRDRRLADYVAARRPCYLLRASLFDSDHFAAILAHPDVAIRYRPLREFADGRHPSIRLTLLADRSAGAQCGKDQPS